MPPQLAISSLRERAITLAARALDRVARPSAPVPAPKPETVRRIVVVKPCCLGDLLMATPVPRSLGEAFPGARIDVVTTPWSAPALTGNPHVAEILTYPPRITPWQLGRLAWTLRRRHYDLGISLDRSPTVNALLRLAGIPVRAGIDSGGRGIGLTHRVAPDPDHPTHETELFLQVLEPLGIAPGRVEPEYHVPPEALGMAERLIPCGAGPVVLMHPGGAVNPGTTMLSKRWPPASFAALATRLVNELGAEVMLVGAGSDRTAVDAVTRHAEVPLLNFCGWLSLPALAALSARADLYVGNDSGTTHLAAAVGTPTVTIFGPTSPRRYRPLGARSRVCAPAASWGLAASDLRRHSAGGPATAIDQVTVDEVFAACRELLEAAS